MKTIVSSLLTAWAGGALVTWIAEVALLRDLPRLPFGALVEILAAGGIVYLPLSLLALPVAYVVARRVRGRAFLVGGGLLLAAPVWLAAVAGLVPHPERPGRPLEDAGGLRVVVLGLDGASWDVLRPLIDAGDLPNLERFVSAGASGPLASLEPTLSNRVWTSAATGVVPERHGITDFFFDRRYIRVPTVWDLVHTLDGRVGLFEYLVTDPPFPFNGFVVPGWMANRPTETHPEDLVRRIRYVTAVRHPWAVARYYLRRERVDARHNLREFIYTKLAATMFLDLYARYEPDVSACVWYGTDRLGHKMWRYFQPEAMGIPLAEHEEPFRDLIPAYCREFDREFGRVVRELDDGRTTLILMSDHGMGPMDTVKVTGYPRGDALLRALGLHHAFRVASPHSEMFLNARLEGREAKPTVSLGEHEAHVTDAVRKISAITLEDGGPLFEVERGDMEKVDIKVRVRGAGGLDPDDIIHVGDQGGVVRELVQLVETSGNHRLHGILALIGPGVHAGTTIDDAVITDIAPTILYQLGLPTAADLDGRVLTEAFDPEWLARRPHLQVPSFGAALDSIAGKADPGTEVSEELIERLRGLGYIQ